MIATLLTACASQSPSPDTSKVDASVESSKKEIVQFAGFAYMGDADKTKNRFPYAHQINQKQSNGQFLLDQRLFSSLKQTTPRHIQFNEQLGRRNRGEQLGLVAGLESETVFVSKVEQQYLTRTLITAQIMVVDFSTLSIVAAYPVVPVEYTDTYGHYPSEKDVKRQFQIMYSENGAIYDAITNRIIELKIKQKKGNNLQVTQSTVEQRAYRDLPDHIRKEPAIMEQFLAQSFSAYLSSNQQVSILPYRKDYAIGNRLAAQFSDGEVYQMSLPETDYAIELTLRGFASKEHDRIGSVASYVNASYHTVRFVQPLLDKTYLEAKFKKVVRSRQSLGAGEPDHWQPYFESILKSMTSSVSSYPVPQQPGHRTTPETDKSQNK